MNLAQVGLRRVAPDARAVLHAHPEVRVTVDAETREQPDALLVALDERVRRAAAHGGHDPAEVALRVPHAARC